MALNDVSPELLSLLASIAASIDTTTLTRGIRPLPQQLTVANFCDELQISSRTFYEWRAKGRAPKCVKLPNGELRIRRTEFENWLTGRMEAA